MSEQGTNHNFIDLTEEPTRPGSSKAAQTKPDPDSNVKKIKDSHSDIKHIVQEAAKKLDQLKSLKMPNIVAKQPHQVVRFNKPNSGIKVIDASILMGTPQPTEYSLEDCPPSPPHSQQQQKKPNVQNPPGTGKRFRKKQRLREVAIREVANMISLASIGLVPAAFQGNNPINIQGQNPNFDPGMNPNNSQGQNTNINPGMIPNNNPGNQQIKSKQPGKQPQNIAKVNPLLNVAVNKSEVNNYLNMALQKAGMNPTPQSRLEMLGIMGQRQDSDLARAVSYRAGIPRSFLAKEGLPPCTWPAPNNNAPIPSLFAQTFKPTFTANYSETQVEANAPMFVETDNLPDEDKTYSPTDAFTASELYAEEFLHHDSEPGQKRLSAFQRLGPVTQPKKPKMTINLLFSKEHGEHREVVDADDPHNVERPKTPEPIPVYRRQDVIDSADHTVIRFLPFWPWRGNKIVARKTAVPRKSKSVMMFELEQMVEVYDDINAFVQVSITGYPKTFTKEDVLDLLLASLKNKCFIPCFIEFTPLLCKFLAIRCRGPLQALHRMGLMLDCNGGQVSVCISLINLTLSELEYIPKLILKKRLVLAYDGERTLDLEAFCLQPDVSHFIYFPLNNLPNQNQLINLKTVNWNQLVELNLARNRITTLEGFELSRNAPKLRVLDLSHNYIDNVKVLLQCRSLALRSLKLEGNPLCGQYIESDRYVQVAKMVFPTLTHLDGIPLHRNNELPPCKRNFAPVSFHPTDPRELVDKFLSTYFPLLEQPEVDRMLIEDMYDEDAIWTLTYRFKMRCLPMYRRFRDLFTRSRCIEEDNLACVEGSAHIASHLSRWPMLRHDPFTFTVDVLHHTENDTICRIGGILNVTSNSLAEDEHMLYFTRTLTLHTKTGTEYKIKNELVNWDFVTEECARTAFKMTQVKSKKLSLKVSIGFDADDDNLKEDLLGIFVKITDSDKTQAYRCLEQTSWDLKSAVEYFMRLVKIECGKMM